MLHMENTVREYVRRDFFAGAPAEIDSNASLSQAGIIDSMGLFRLIFFLEQTYVITVAETEMTGENLDTLFKISEFIKRKTSDQRV